MKIFYRKDFISCDNNAGLTPINSSLPDGSRGHVLMNFKNIFLRRFSLMKIFFVCFYQRRHIATEAWGFICCNNNAEMTPINSCLADGGSGHEFLNFKNISFEMIFFWEDFSLSKEAYSPRQSPHKEVGQNPFMLAWVTNLSTSPDLNIEFIQVGFEQTPRLHHAFLKHDWHSNLKDKLPAKQ